MPDDENDGPPRKVIDLRQRAKLLADLRNAKPDVNDRFLLDEGLELLAIFRDIADPQKREMIMNLIRATAREQDDERQLLPPAD